MDGAQRNRLAREALAGTPNGPDAPQAALRHALARAEEARAVILVEGPSDQLAVEATAARLHHDLGADGIVVIPVGGIQAMPAMTERFGPHGRGLVVAGLGDAAEEGILHRAVRRGGLGTSATRDDLARLGFEVCVRDLEAELIRACGVPAMDALLHTQGDLDAFRTLQRQPAWRHRPAEEQLHRWLRAGARRNLRYARLLIEATEPDGLPAPLVKVLEAVAAT